MEEKNEKFEELGLSNKINKALQDAGYEKTTPIQAKAIPQILKGKDIIGQSQTGTGKTASYSLPIIEKIDKDNKNVQAIILAPTRELAIQITEEIRKFTKYEEQINCLAIYGGEQIENQIKRLKKGVKIIIGTPGRVIDHINRKTLKLNNIKMVVLDEADEMLKMGFEEDINTILSTISEDRQTILFSATMNPKIANIAKKYLKNPINIKVKSKQLTVENIEQISLELKQGMKDEVVMRLIEINNPKKVVIFCNTKKKADNLIEVLKQKGYKAECLHGDIKQTQRQRIMNMFKNGDFKILVATDVVARGIDVDELELVINYDIPQEEEYYVHRIGRTGRNGNKGKAYTFVVGKEKNKIKGIEKYANTKMLVGKLPTLEQVNEVRNNKLIKKINETIKSKSRENNEIVNKILNKLLEKNNLEEISKALIYLISVKQNQNNTKKYENDKMIKLFLNLGKKDGISNKDIVGSILSNSAIELSSIGKIKILDKFSFLEVKGEFVNEILSGMKGKQIKKKNCNIEIANV